MSAPQFTPGPWRIESDEAAYSPPCVVIMAGDSIIAEVLADEKSKEPDAEVSATARLIAAAPELYAELEWLAEHYDLGVIGSERAEKLLAKARGEQ